MLLPILTAPDPILNKAAQPVRIFDDKLKKLSGDMIQTMRQNDGMGLAAPQVGESIKLLVVELMPKEEDKVKVSPIPLRVLVNPKIIWSSRKTTIMEEGCLSLPKINMNIERPDAVKIIYYDIEGRRHRLRAKDLLARLCQHEIDHLNGILITDHIDVNIAS